MAPIFIRSITSVTGLVRESQSSGEGHAQSLELGALGSNPGSATN